MSVTCWLVPHTFVAKNAIAGWGRSGAGVVGFGVIGTFSSEFKRLRLIWVMYVPTGKGSLV